MINTATIIITTATPSHVSISIISTATIVIITVTTTVVHVRGAAKTT